VIRGSVYVLGTTQVTVHGVTVQGGGIYIEDSSGIVVAACTLEGPGGIVVRSSSATLRGNAITGSGSHGILVTLASRALIAGNRVSRSGGDGIHVAASMADIRENEVRDNVGYGIWADGHSTIAGQTAFASITGNTGGTLGGNARTLDREPPATPTGLTVTPADWTGGTIAVAWTSPEDLSGIAAAWYKLETAPQGPDDGIRAVGNPLTLTAPPEGRQPVFLWLEDRAGNKSEVSRAEAIVLFDRTPPTGRVVAAGGARYVFSTGVTLAVEAEDRAGDGPGSGVTALRLSNDGQTWSPWEAFATPVSWDLVRSGGSSAPGPKTVFLELRDKAGNVAQFTTEVALVQTLVYPEPILSLAFTRAGDLLAHGTPTGAIRILNIATGQEARILRGHTGGVYAVAFSPDGRLLASGSNDNTVRLWDTATGREARVLRGHTGGVWAVAFSSDGKTLASGSSDATVRLWETTTGKHVRTLSEHTAPVRSVAFSPDGKLLTSGSDDRTVRVWDPSTGKRKYTITEHTGSVRSVAFSPDGKVLASASTDGRVGLWDAATGKVLRTILSHAGGVRSVAFSPDGKSLASGSTTGKVVVWSVATGEELHALDGHTDQINALAYSPDGRLASAGNDKEIRLWDFGP